jgi:hypothetical protein
MGEDVGAVTHIHAVAADNRSGRGHSGGLEPSTSSPKAIQAVLETTMRMGVPGLPGI